MNRSAQKMLLVLSAWLQRWTDWTARLAAQLEARPAGQGEPPTQADGPASAALGTAREDWQARTQSRPPAHWLEHIRQASAGPLVEIHAQAQPEPSPDEDAALLSAMRPEAGETFPKAPSPAVQSARPGQAPPPSSVLVVPADRPHPVLRLGPAPFYTRRGPQPEAAAGAAARERDQAGAASSPAGARQEALRPPGQTRTRGGQEMPGLTFPAGEPRPAGSAGAAGNPHPPGPQTGLRFTAEEPGPLGSTEPAQSEGPGRPPASPAAQPVPPAQGKPPDWPSQAPGIPRWPDPLPAQAPSPPDFKMEAALPAGQPPVQKHSQEMTPPSEAGEKAFPRSSGSWPDLPTPLPEDEEGDGLLGDARLQLQRRQRLDQEQRGDLWNT